MSNDSDDNIMPKNQIDSPSGEEGEEGSSGRSSSGGGQPLKKVAWTSTEDAILIDYVKKHGEGNWNAVQKHSGLHRCGKSCRLRWANHLRPNLKKGPFTAEEEQLIIELHSSIGNKWAKMATQLCQNQNKVPYQYQVKGTSKPTIASFQASDLSPFLWSRQDCAFTNSQRVLLPDVSIEAASVSSFPLHLDTSFRETTVPRLKSITWTMQNKNSRHANRVAIIILKLQDPAMSTGEIEVKFEVSKDTLEAMLRSMTHIKEKLSNSVEPPGQVAKKQKQYPNIMC